jgi:hypothetical protein
MPNWISARPTLLNPASTYHNNAEKIPAQRKNTRPRGYFNPICCLKIAIPELKAFKTKKFDINQPIKEIVESLNRSLAPKYRSELYRLYRNGELLDQEKFLISYTIGSDVSYLSFI